MRRSLLTAALAAIVIVGALTMRYGAKSERATPLLSDTTKVSSVISDSTNAEVQVKLRSIAHAGSTPQDQSDHLLLSVPSGTSVTVRCITPDVAGPDNWYYVTLTDGEFTGVSGYVKGNLVKDPARVPSCDSSILARYPQTPGQVTLTQGPPAQHGYYYAVKLTGFVPNRTYHVGCYDNGGYQHADPFRIFALRTDTSGNAFADNGCYSGDGDLYWVEFGPYKTEPIEWHRVGSPGGNTPPPTPAPTTPTLPTPPTVKAVPTTVSPPAHQPVRAYDNWGSTTDGHAVCRGNPGNELSVPGGAVSQTFTVRPGVASLSSAIVQIDRDPAVTAHLSVAVDNSVVARTDATAANDTVFGFGPVQVSAGQVVTLSISFTATYGKLTTVYTVGSPGGVFMVSNSCPDHAPSLRTSSGLRAIVAGSS